jgi:hypothetical protein
MKLQFNLLPDVKQDYLKAQRTKRTVIAAAIAASAISLFILLLMATTVYVINKKQLSDADGNIKKYTNQLKAIPNLDKILTIQNQLKSVSTLHQSKHLSSRLYQYLPEITPTNVCVGSLTLDMINNSLTIGGTTDSLKTINTYVDTLKFTDYKSGGKDTGKKAFPSVLETQFGLTDASKGGGTTCAGKPANATYGLTVTFDPALFSNASTVDLEVPVGLATTRSVLDDPSSLFTGQTKDTLNQSTKGGGQ